MRRKPGRAASTSQAPIGSDAMKNRPSAPVTRRTENPVARWVASTSVPGSTAPDSSRTTPASSPVLVCAAAVAAMAAGKSVSTLATTTKQPIHPGDVRPPPLRPLLCILP